jgi:hypothetical protein
VPSNWSAWPVEVASRLPLFATRDTIQVGTSNRRLLSEIPSGIGPDDALSPCGELHPVLITGILFRNNPIVPIQTLRGESGLERAR